MLLILLNLVATHGYVGITIAVKMMVSYFQKADYIKQVWAQHLPKNMAYL